MKGKMKYGILATFSIIVILLLLKSCKHEPSPCSVSICINDEPFLLDGIDFSAGGIFPEDTTYIKEVIVGQELQFRLNDSLVQDFSVLWTVLEEEGISSSEKVFFYSPSTEGNKTVKIQVGEQTYWIYLSARKGQTPPLLPDTTQVPPGPCSTENPEIQVSDRNGGEISVGDDIEIVGLHLETCYKNVEWDYNGDGRADNTGLRFEHSFETPGSKIIRLSLTDKQTNKVIKLQKVIIVKASQFTPPPSTCTTLNDPTIQVNGGAGNEVMMDENVRFSSSADACYQSYQWDFNADNQFDAFSSAAGHKFDNVGKYNVRLVVKGQNGQQSSTDKEVFVRVSKSKLTALFTEMLRRGQTRYHGAKVPIQIEERFRVAEETVRSMLLNGEIPIKDSNNVSKGPYSNFIIADLKSPTKSNSVEVIDIKYDNNTGKIRAIALNIQ